MVVTCALHCLEIISIEKEKNKEKRDESVKYVTQAYRATGRPCIPIQLWLQPDPFPLQHTASQRLVTLDPGACHLALLVGVISP